MKQRRGFIKVIILCGKVDKESLTVQAIYKRNFFKSSNYNFAQIYKIHTDNRSSKKETNIHPVLFALLPNTNKGSYIGLFHEIFKSVPECTPVKVTINFEGSIISVSRNRSLQ